MKALTWQGIEDVRVMEVPDPRIQEPTDAIVRVTSTAICGSDLHLYKVLAPYLTPGDILGHEFMGIVEEVGGAVENLSPGDRVVIPFTISCGHCFMCDRGLYSQCETTQNTDEGKGASLFGYTRMYGAVPGGQAELVRVPHADFGPIKLPPLDQGHEDERYLYLSDILPTAWQGIEYADVPEGGSLAIIGLGPVGQMAVRAARHRGITTIIGIDRIPERLAAAEAQGATVINRDEVKDVTMAVRDLTDGRGADSVLEAVGMEAHGSPFAEKIVGVTSHLPGPLARLAMEKSGIDRMAALHRALDIVRRGGTVSISGVYGGMADPLPMMEMFDKGLTLRMGQCNVKRWTDELYRIVNEDQDLLDVQSLATHRLPLDEAAEAYKMFQTKSDGCMKVVLKP